MTLPKLRAPIVLVHGLLGSEKRYFPGIPEAMRDAGNRVLIPSLERTAGIAVRAAQLKDFLLRHAGCEPVHIIGHSMGGLDSRYMISCLGMADRVLTLTTLGTPHRGTSFADWGINRLSRLVKPILEMLAIPTQGFYDLTTASCRTFNEKVQDAPGVRYFSVAGEHDGSYLTPEWVIPYPIVERHEGANDGVVSVASAKWGEDLDVWEGDHFALVNWLNPFARHRGFFRDPVPRYRRILGKLADLGY